MMKNFLGLEAHPSDEHLHWSDSYTEAEKLREAWDAIVALGQGENLNFIVQHAAHSAMLREADLNAGADL